MGGGIKKKKSKVSKSGHNLAIETADLTEKQLKFCKEYVWDYNGTRAYQKVYECQYDTARANAADLLAKTSIKDRIRWLKENLEESSGITRDMILDEHRKLAFSSIAHLHNTWIERKEFENLTAEQKACIAEITTQTRMEMIAESPVQVDYVKIKLFDKQKALDSISKILGFDAPKKMDVSFSGERKAIADIFPLDNEESGK